MAFCFSCFAGGCGCKCRAERVRWWLSKERLGGWFASDKNNGGRNRSEVVRDGCPAYSLFYLIRRIRSEWQKQFVLSTMEDKGVYVSVNGEVVVRRKR